MVRHRIHPLLPNAARNMDVHQDGESKIQNPESLNQILGATGAGQIPPPSFKGVKGPIFSQNNVGLFESEKAKC